MYNNNNYLLNINNQTYINLYNFNDVIQMNKIYNNYDSNSNNNNQYNSILDNGYDFEYNHINKKNLNNDINNNNYNNINNFENNMGIITDCFKKNNYQDNEENLNYQNEKIILVGLNNLGSTCFMNSVIQALNTIIDFSDKICSLNIKSSSFPITTALKEVFYNLRKPENHPYNPLEFYSTICKYSPKFIEKKPNDSRQLLQYILDSIHNELNINKNEKYMIEDNSEETNWNEKLNYEINSFNFENKSIITDLFYGILANETHCNNCNKISYVFQHFNILTLPIFTKNNDKINLKDMIEDYSKEQNLIKKNNYCLICKDYHEAKSKNVFYKLPSILIIYPGRKNYGVKYNIKINFERELSIELSKNLDNKIISYNLISIIYHLGSCGEKGHNVALCNKNDIWFMFNDSEITIIDISSISGEGILLLIYQQK